MTRRRRGSRGAVAAQFGAVTWSLLAAVPFVLIVLLAFKSNSDIFTNPLGVIDVDWRPENFAEAWSGPPGGQGFAVYLLNSAIVTTIAIAGCLFFGAFLGYFATLASRRLRTFVIRAFLAATTLPLI